MVRAGALAAWAASLLAVGHAMLGRGNLPLSPAIGDAAIFDGDLALADQFIEHGPKLPVITIPEIATKLFFVVVEIAPEIVHAA